MPRILVRNEATARLRAVAGATAVALVGVFLGASPADAQILRSPINVPPLPKLDSSLGVDPALRGTLQTLSPQALEDLRVLRLRTLIRAHSDVLESDPHGAPIVRREILAWSPEPGALERATSSGFAIGRRTSLDASGELVVLIAPPGISTRSALRQLRHADPSGTYEFNHVFLTSGDPHPAPARTSGPAESAPVDAAVKARVGLVDAGVDGTHPVFEGLGLHRWGCADVAVPSSHGTAVASLLAGRATSFRGAAPGAEVFAADVFCGAATGGAVDAVAAAIAWLLHEGVPVINVSLVGPPNAVLERIIRLVITRGTIVVAAVGNDGPAAPAAYPASYPGVIAVTAVDARRHVLLEAGRALHVDVAAPGADMLAADPPNSYAAVRGTSFAAPLVAGLLARELMVPDPIAATAAVEHLEASAVAPSDPAFASRYGKGVVGEALRVPVPALPAGRKAPPGSF
jgi:hypothetical protein